MRYELIGKNNLFNPIETILNNRGIEDIQSFLNLDESVTHDWRLLNNIEKAAKTLIENIDKNIFLQIDEDNDGYFSSAIIYNYLMKINPSVKITWRTHGEKMHGINLDAIPDNTDIVIIPDAGSNQYKEHKLLKEKGMIVIILDHHQCDKESKDAIVVNNQLSKNYPNKQFSGCGIVYKFCKALDYFLNCNFADEYLDLVAIGNIADSMLTSELETRYYIQQGLKNINNPLVKAIVKNNEYTLKGKVTIKDVSWTIAPLVNSVTRIGNLEERRNMFKALTYHKETIYNNRKKETEPIEKAMARIMSNIRARQGRKRDASEEAIIKRIEEKGITLNKFIIVDGTDIVDPSLTGVTAIKIVERYRKPTLLFRLNKDGIFTGSARGYDKCEVKDLRSFLNSTEKFIFCEGHAQAHGFAIDPNNISEINEIINNKLKDVDMETNVHYVDLKIKATQLNENLIRSICQYKGIWGKGIEEPLLLIKKIEVNTDDILLQGKNKNTIKFVHKGIEYIKFRSSEDEFNSIVNKGERLILDIVGFANLNEYEKKITSQIIIEDFEINQIEKKAYVF